MRFFAQYAISLSTHFAPYAFPLITPFRSLRFFALPPWSHWRTGMTVHNVQPLRKSENHVAVCRGGYVAVYLVINLSKYNDPNYLYSTDTMRYDT
jgi:hypothetical protein